MKRLIMPVAALLLSSLLALPALAVEKGGKPSDQPTRQVHKNKASQKMYEGEAFKRQKAYVEKRNAMKQRRDESLKVREGNVKTNNPGKTGP